MNAARQALRFSIPGSLLLLLTLGLVVAGRAIQGASYAGILDGADRNGAAVVAILAAISLGFVVYQFYYLTVAPFVRVGIRQRRRWPRIDRGARVLLAFSPDERRQLDRIFGVVRTADAEIRDEQRNSPPAAGSVPQATGVEVSANLSATTDAGTPLRLLGVQELSPHFLEAWGIDTDDRFAKRDRYDEAADDYEERWRMNWDVLRTLIEQAAAQRYGRPIKDEFTVLSDVYHALGACRTACTIAWIVSVAVVLVGLALHVTHLGESGMAWERSLPAIFVISIVPATLWVVLNQTRHRTWKSTEMNLKYGLHYLLMREPGMLEPK